MKATAANLAALADQFLVAYACTSSVEPSHAALFNIGHAAELYLKAVLCLHEPGADLTSVGHNVASLLRRVQTHEPTLLAQYILRQQAIDRYVTNVDLPSTARGDPDYDHYNHNRELYRISTYLADTKYLFASHSKKLSGKSFVVMVMSLNEYWQPFFKELRSYLLSKGVQLSPHLRKALENPRLPPAAHTYIQGLA